MEYNSIMCGDALSVLRTFDDNSIDAIVTDPPYGLGKIKDLPGLLAAWMRGEDGASYQTKGFMSRSWDIVPPPTVWAEMLRVVKPGGHLLAFAGTRTWDMMSLSIRLAGFELRDSLDNETQAFRWLYGSGFPKSQDISKALDKAAGAKREVLGRRVYADGTKGHATNSMNEGYQRQCYDDPDNLEKYDTAPATPEAQAWSGWGTALKPAWEPVLLFRKPISESTVAANVLKHGTGGINVDGARVEGDIATFTGQWKKPPKEVQGRWPANVLLSHLETCTEDACSDGCSVREVGQQSGIASTTGKRSAKSQEATVPGTAWGTSNHKSKEYPGDVGTAARYFAQFRYQAKPGKRERDAGCDSNVHPTVKPVALLRHLVRLVTPPGGVVLDPFIGSGTTLIAASLEGFSYIGIERDVTYCDLARKRLAYHEGTDVLCPLICV